jgi:hypothetical protein
MTVGTMEILIGFTNVDNASTFPMQVTPSTTIGYIKSAPEMERFFAETLQLPLEPERLFAIRSGQVCEDTDTVQSLGIAAGTTVYFMRKVAQVLLSSTSSMPSLVPIGSPLMRSNEPAPKQSHYLADYPRIELSDELRDEGFTLLARVGLLVSNSELPKELPEPCKTADSLPCVFNDVPVSLTTPWVACINRMCPNCVDFLLFIIVIVITRPLLNLPAVPYHTCCNS